MRSVDGCRCAAICHGRGVTISDNIISIYYLIFSVHRVPVYAGMTLNCRDKCRYDVAVLSCSVERVLHDVHIWL